MLVLILFRPCHGQLIPKTHILHILCGVEFTVVTVINFSPFCPLKQIVLLLLNKASNGALSYTRRNVAPGATQVFASSAQRSSYLHILHHIV